MQDVEIQRLREGPMEPTSFASGLSYPDYHNPSVPHIAVPPPSYPQNPYNEAYNIYTNPSTPQMHDATTGLDNLAQAAMSTTEHGNGHVPAMEIDPNLAATPINFPTFPHDIFIPGAQTFASHNNYNNPSLTSDDWCETQLVPFGSEANGLPPKDLLEILYILWRS
jgi:hypothetical protein